MFINTQHHKKVRFVLLNFFCFYSKVESFRQKGRKKLIKLKRMCVTHNWIKVVGIKLTVIFFFLKITQFFSQTKTNLCDGSNSCYMFKMTLLLLGLIKRENASLWIWFFSLCLHIHLLLVYAFDLRHYVKAYFPQVFCYSSKQMSAQSTRREPKQLSKHKP